jgi:hypothetical protein
VANGAATNQIRCVCNSISQPKRSGLTTSGESHSDDEVLGCENIDGAITKRGHCNSCPSDVSRDYVILRFRAIALIGPALTTPYQS